MERSNTTKAIEALKATALLGLLSLACSAPPQDGGSAWNNGAGTVATGVRETVLCANSNAPEYYRLSAMNAKLRHYPDLAAELGMDSVSDCEGARAFIAGLRAYRRAHPGFDRDEPLEWPELSMPARPDDSQGSIEYPKIRGGMPITNLPVVQIKDKVHPTTNPDYKDIKGGDCTGTFIAKNFILTAAHCITDSAVDWCIQNNLTLAQCEPKWFKYSKLTIRFGGFTLTDVWAVHDVHPAWMGRFPKSNTPDLPGSTYDEDEGARRDIAMIYIDDDSRLPFNVELDGAKRVSILDPATGVGNPLVRWPLFFYGWTTPPGQADALHVSTSTPTFSVDILNGGDTIQGVYSGPTSNPCEGDSGGPLVRRLPLITNDGTRQESREAIVGVLNGGDTTCTAPPTVNQIDTWARVDTAVDFIQGFEQRWYGPYFECQERPDANGPITQMAVAECWGSPCREPADCGSRELGMYCSNSGRDLAEKRGSCDTCTTQPGGGCACVVGQCLWGPTSLPPRPPGGP